MVTGVSEGLSEPRGGIAADHQTSLLHSPQRCCWVSGLRSGFGLCDRTPTPGPNNRDLAHRLLLFQGETGSGGGQGMKSHLALSQFWPSITLGIEKTREAFRQKDKQTLRQDRHPGLIALCFSALCKSYVFYWLKVCGNPGCQAVSIFLAMKYFSIKIYIYIFGHNATAHITENNII